MAEGYVLRAEDERRRGCWMTGTGASLERKQDLEECQSHHGQEDSLDTCEQTRSYVAMA